MRIVSVVVLRPRDGRAEGAASSDDGERRRAGENGHHPPRRVGGAEKGRGLRACREAEEAGGRH